MATGSLQEHNPLALLTIIALGLLVGSVLAVYGGVTLARRGTRSPSPAVIVRALAAFAASAATGVYVWGAVYLMLLDDTRRIEACQRTVGAAHAMDIDGYGRTYLPLRLECHIAGGRTYSTSLPAHINAIVLVLAVVTGVLAVTAAVGAERRARQVFSKEKELR